MARRKSFALTRRPPARRTNQTTIAAPIAALVKLLWSRPRIGWSAGITKSATPAPTRTPIGTRWRMSAASPRESPAAALTRTGGDKPAVEFPHDRSPLGLAEREPRRDLFARAPAADAEARNRVHHAYLRARGRRGGHVPLVKQRSRR